jgi:hypothetical protein
MPLCPLSALWRSRQPAWPLSSSCVGAARAAQLSATGCPLLHACFPSSTSGCGSTWLALVPTYVTAALPSRLPTLDALLAVQWFGARRRPACSFTPPAPNLDPLADADAYIRAARTRGCWLCCRLQRRSTCPKEGSSGGMATIQPAAAACALDKICSGSGLVYTLDVVCLPAESMPGAEAGPHPVGRCGRLSKHWVCVRAIAGMPLSPRDSREPKDWCMGGGTARGRGRALCALPGRPAAQMPKARRAPAQGGGAERGASRRAKAQRTKGDRPPPTAPCAMKWQGAGGSALTARCQCKQVPRGGGKEASRGSTNRNGCEECW